MEWGIFAATVAALFAADLLAKPARGVRGALWRTSGYVAVALVFGGLLWLRRGPDDGIKYLTGYVLEMSLSLDNVFVISLIFGALAIPRELRQRVLTIGILSAFLLRGMFIGAGVVLAGASGWFMVLCGAFLIYTGCKSLLTNEEAEVDLEKNRVLRLLRRVFPITPKLHGARFVVGLSVTPLFVAMVLVEIADVIFAADSVPATLAVTQDPLLVYSSNIFAILGLRALYQVLEAVVTEFEYVGKAVALVLVLIGAKVIFHIGGIEVPNLLSLGVVGAFLSAGLAASLIARARKVAA